MKLTTDIHPVLRLGWSYTSAPHIYLHDIDRENFIFYFVLYFLCIKFITTPGLSVHMHHLSNIYCVYKNMYVYEFEMFEAQPAYMWYI